MIRQRQLSYPATTDAANQPLDDNQRTHPNNAKPQQSTDGFAPLATTYNQQQQQQQPAQLKQTTTAATFTEPLVKPANLVSPVVATMAKQVNGGGEKQADGAQQPAEQLDVTTTKVLVEKKKSVKSLKSMKSEKTLKSMKKSHKSKRIVTMTVVSPTNKFAPPPATNKNTADQAKSHESTGSNYYKEITKKHKDVRSISQYAFMRPKKLLPAPKTLKKQ